jgi:hypothetical protein
MFPVAVVLVILGYTFMYCGLANASNGGTGPSVWTALGWGEAPTLGGKLGSAAGSAAGNALNKLYPNNVNPQTPPTFTQV